MNVLVTGGSGYVGSHVAKMLYEQGYQPVVFDLQAKLRNWASPHWPAICGDINNKWHLERLFNDHSFDAVIHLAAASEVGASVTEPLRYYQNNVGGSANVLDVCEQYGVKKFIFSSTSSVYGEVDPKDLPTKETHSKNPATSYGASKLAVEYMLRDADRAHDIRYVALRYFNASGAAPDGSIGEFRVKPTHLIPSIQEVYDGDKEFFTVNGIDYPTPDGTAVRDFTHVWDIASAHIQALRYLTDGNPSDVFNIGGGDGKSVAEVLNEYQEQIGKSIVVQTGERRPGDISMNYADITKAKNVLKWEPVMSDTRSIVRDAIQWARSDLYGHCRNSLRKDKMRQLAVNMESQ